MPLIYITGVPSSGKSTVRQSLIDRGYTALGGAEDGLAAFYVNETGERIDRWVTANERTPEWYDTHTWKIPRATIEQLKASSIDKPIFVCATTTNEKDELWDLFDTVIALTIDERTLRSRIATRTNNDVGKTPEELEAILQRQQTAQEDYERLGAILVDATRPIEHVVDEILTKVGV